MSYEREIYGVAILSKDRIHGMSRGSLSKYLLSVKSVRSDLWHSNKTVCCEICNEVMSVDREYTEEEIKEIKTFDWLYHEIKRSKDEKKKVVPKHDKEVCRRRQKVST